MVDLKATYTITRDVLFRELEGEMVLLNKLSATYFSLNETGSEVWRRLSGHATVEEICQGMAETYHIPKEKLVADLTQLIEELLNAGLIQPNS
ncbi:MAG: hypothetical protein DMF66_01655 [Acidobacteria bacterium]|nr:MAG: hypothetical protein DMF66_01655 [Acidobacteriota bacterium]